MIALYQYKATVKRVVDGDTVDLFVDLGFRVTTTQRFRLLDLDAPEMRGAERDRGIEAKAFVESMLPVGSRVVVVSEKTGKFGRWLGTLWINGVSVNHEIIRNGHIK